MKKLTGISFNAELCAGLAHLYDANEVDVIVGFGETGLVLASQVAERVQASRKLPGKVESVYVKRNGAGIVIPKAFEDSFRKRRVLLVMPALHEVAEVDGVQAIIKAIEDAGGRGFTGVRRYGEDARKRAVETGLEIRSSEDHLQ